MDSMRGSCIDQRKLRELVWVLTSRHADLSTELLGLVGKNHQMFLSVEAKCHRSHEQIVTARYDLTEHRAVHGC
jgi:hypothetical protein